MSGKIAACIDDDERADAADKHREQQAETVQVEGQFHAQRRRPWIGCPKGLTGRNVLDATAEVDRQAAGRAPQASRSQRPAIRCSHGAATATTNAERIAAVSPHGSTLKPRPLRPAHHVHSQPKALNARAAAALDWLPERSVVVEPNTNSCHIDRPLVPPSPTNGLHFLDLVENDPVADIIGSSG